MNVSSALRTYPMKVDDNVVRAVASLTFLIGIILLLQSNVQFLIYFLFPDFILRYIHPKLSPSSQLMKYINIDVLKNNPQYRFSPPKRFAILIGIIITGLMSFSSLIGWDFFFKLCLYSLILASGLQSWFDYCLGCSVYDWLIKLNIVGRGENHNDFMQHLTRLSQIGEISENNLSGAMTIQQELYHLASELDGALSEEENVMIEQINEDIRAFAELLEQALKDGVIDESEKNQLLKEGNDVAKLTYEMAPSSARAKTYLIMVQDCIDHLSRKLIKNWH